MSAVSRLKFFCTIPEFSEVSNLTFEPVASVGTVFKNNLIAFANKTSGTWTCAKACVERCEEEFVRDNYRFDAGRDLSKTFCEVLDTIGGLDLQRASEINERFEKSLALCLENKWIDHLGKSFVLVNSISDRTQRLNAAKDWGEKFKAGLYFFNKWKGRGFNQKNIESTLTMVGHVFHNLLLGCEKFLNDPGVINEKDLETVQQLIRNHFSEANRGELNLGTKKDGQQLINRIAATILVLHNYRDCVKGLEERVWKKTLTSSSETEFKPLVKAYTDMIIRKKI
ncbi:MAG: hypothetical protein HYX67_05190 [Candidatus Melainabacteria bacterium]|nr:hypothetical protein [Candidatus Melainabacteria bacterium]